MTTLAIMKARIADEIFRSDMTDAISREITSAIGFYTRHRFFFNERRTITFSTVASQSDYDSATSVTSTPSGVSIAHLLSLDAVTITQNNTVFRVMKEASPEVMEQLIGSAGALTGVPYKYSYFAQVLRVYPIPNAAYVIRLRAQIRYPAPADDDEADNAWMVEAEELIRYRAKRNLYLNNLENAEQGQVMKAMEDEAFQALKRESAMRQSIDSFEPSEI